MLDHFWNEEDVEFKMPTFIATKKSRSNWLQIANKLTKLVEFNGHTQLFQFELNVNCSLQHRATMRQPIRNSQTVAGEFQSDWWRLAVSFSLDGPVVTGRHVLF